ncbi:MAG: UDP-N-acetylglucosamine 2-epimerase (non-hydrolyzing) [Crocinitomicaceae bacterium]|nr:UDP-N-acetylglucosamine 2-epimerase (non-hydrolyzing) [Flavobacteriia bacterium]NDC28101.1 UDP-N-acetylglucosamine 2-epimerase (non-hydrolyzing) [Crocinitomicaceae bacterium]
MKKIITVIGARPQIIKAAAISRAIKNNFFDKILEVIVHTGQHYDENMSQIFFEELEIPFPNFNLNVGSGSHGEQTAKMLEGLENIYMQEKPEAVIVYGDTNSTIAAALAAAKIHIPVIHIEAGLRSFNKAMPEEINRIACDHMSTLLFIPSETGHRNLLNEGIKNDQKEAATIDNPKIYLCGDIMYDNSLYFSAMSEQKSKILKELEITTNEFILCTIHRDTNTDDTSNLNAIFRALLRIQKISNLKIILPLHPRTKEKLNSHLDENLLIEINQNKNFKIIPPTGFLDIISLEKNARLIITDSGGLQKEAFFFQKPCVILRDQTEWIEIVENGNALIAGANELKIISSVETLIKRTDFTYPNLYGDGNAANFICKKITEEL